MIFVKLIEGNEKEVDKYMWISHRNSYSIWKGRSLYETSMKSIIPSIVLVDLRG